MAKELEYKVVVSAQKAEKDEKLFRCPRCFKWHTNRWNLAWKADKEEDNIKYANRLLFCNKCEETLWILAESDSPLSNHPAAIAAKNHCEELGRTLN